MLAQLDFWDYVTFAARMMLTGPSVILLVFILGLPGRIRVEDR